MKKILKCLSFPVAIIIGTVLYFNTIIPDTMYITSGSEANIKSLPMVSLSSKSDSDLSVFASTSNINYEAKLLGVIPIKNVIVNTLEEKYVSVSGEPFGIKMFSDGVMIVGFSDIKTPTGYRNPASLVGLRMGDIIVSMNSQKIKSKDDIENVINKSMDSPILVEYLRDDILYTCNLSAVFDIENQTYRTGMWIRDSSAGIGTMTYYDVQNSTFAGLGHAVKDVDTGEEIPLLSGEIVPVTITGIEKSTAGDAGELKGTFMSHLPTGQLLKNSETGVYGSVYISKDDNMMPIAPSTEIVEGTAYIYTTINGQTPEKYEIEIEKISLTSDTMTKNMVMRIVDKELLALTGGIVQGMSGSPIVQNGKLVGAVTHVFVNDPTRGYAIFIENMLESSQSIA